MNPFNQLNEQSRRSFLTNTARTAFGVTLGGASASWFSSAEAAEAIGKSNGKAKNVIYLYMAGGIELYDIQKDPLEMKNLAGKPALTKIQSNLHQGLQVWMS